MSKIVTVVGATGIQGGSVVKALLNSPEYSVRAITRNTNSDTAKSLKSRGVEVVEADINSVDSLRAAFKGSYAIFAVTNFFEAIMKGESVEKSMELETQMGINLADAAAATETLSHYVWSTLPNSRKNSGGKFVVPYYESKNRIDDHIRKNQQLFNKTTFLWIGWYASNMAYPFFKPSPIHTADGSEVYVQLLSEPSSTRLPLLGDEQTNPGVFAKAVLDQPEKTLPGKLVAGVDEHKPYSEVVETYYATAQGIKAQVVQIPKEHYRQIWPVWGGLMDITNSYFNFTDGKSFSSVDQEVLLKDDLGIKGLVGTAEAFATNKLFK
ncbi:NAD(P)-binding protein [Periconia macrospinosa]|uniref:NAD(P)-binding protein n=1 Tax=Periconia macrospinosa TaxID=97972 RepID=A0A2V1DED4_9PLEO|nr:NAD(P)-binding protein [Periconia macrospinosa]